MAPVSVPIGLRGIARRPLAPVHPRIRAGEDGALALRWTRRARGAWTWSDGVDAPLHEQFERYLLIFGPIETPLAMWELAEPRLIIAPSIVAELTAALPGGQLLVRQQGSYALSDPLFLAALT